MAIEGFENINLSDEEIEKYSKMVAEKSTDSTWLPLMLTMMTFVPPKENSNLSKHVDYLNEKVAEMQKILKGKNE